MSTNGKQKGKRGEREFASLLREHGYDARRGQQFKGGNDSDDVVCEELRDKVNFEVKRVERLNIEDAMSQAKADAGDRIPIVAHRKNNGEWLLTFRACDILPKLEDAI